MKSTRMCFCLLPLLVLTLLIQAVAFESASTWIRVASPSVVSGKELKPGEYQLKWVTGSSECQATLYKRGKPVLEFRGKLVNRDTRTPETTISAANGPDGKPVIKEIRIGGTATVLVVE